MTNIIRVFWGGLALLSGLWVMTAPGVLGVDNVFALRSFMLQYTGILAMGCMSAAMVLALRPRGLERPLGGLDKMYRLHKWLGIGGLVLAIAHWLWVEGPKWATDLGLVTRPQRGPRPEISDPVAAFMASLRDPAEGLGEWAFYAVVALIVVALIPRIPYRQFLRLHRLLPVAYLVLVFHSVVLADAGYWLGPLGLVMAVMFVAGSYGAVVSILGRIGANRRVAGRIAELHGYPGVQSLEKMIDLEPGWPGHKPGQFAFLTSDPRDGAHPYTLASAWDPTEPRIGFVAKALGDHTGKLAETLKPGMPVTVEGPYGCFTFEDDCPVQIWVGGGIGVTPFIAAMKALKRQGGPGRREVHLFHTTSQIDQAALDRLEQDAREAGIHWHLTIDARDGRLTGARIREAVPRWREASLWFCGPVGFGAALRKDFDSLGFPVRKRFHQELFAMR